MANKAERRLDTYHFERILHAGKSCITVLVGNGGLSDVHIPCGHGAFTSLCGVVLGLRYSISGRRRNGETLAVPRRISLFAGVGRLRLQWLLELGDFCRMVRMAIGSQAGSSQRLRGAINGRRFSILTDRACRHVTRRSHLAERRTRSLKRFVRLFKRSWHVAAATESVGERVESGWALWSPLGRFRASVCRQHDLALATTSQHRAQPLQPLDTRTLLFRLGRSCAQKSVL